MIKVIRPHPKMVDLYRRTEGKAWEPKDVTSPSVDRLVERGYVRRVNGRCGFELLPDALLDWTPAGRAALSGPAAEVDS